MKKAAILTINDYDNYGNRLQNYAVQEILRKKGLQVETIVHELDTRYLYKRYKGNNLLDNIPIKIKKKFKAISTKLYSNKEFNKITKERVSNFKNFTRENIAETKFVISENKIPKDLGNRYDYFFTGSDQVWNPNFRVGSSIDFLTFAPREKRIALSPSIGIDNIPPEFVEIYKKYLNELNGISVREYQGANIIKELSGRESEVLIDPTLYLSKTEWLKISKPHSKKPNEKYLLTYFLGEITKEYKVFIEKYTKREGLKIVNLYDKDSINYYTADPSNFIDFINSAQAFFTDSYHGIIFSIIMETPFLIFEREDKIQKMNSRLETLNNIFNLDKNYYFCGKNSLPRKYSAKSYEEIISTKKAKVDKYLKSYIRV